MATPQKKTTPKAALKAAPMAAALADTGQDFVVKELQSSADDAIKLAYGSMTLPPKQFLDLFSQVGEEYLKFVARRMQAQAGRIGALSQCTSIEEIAREEMGFFGKAAQEYAEQFDRMAEVTHDAAKASQEQATPKR